MRPNSRRRTERCCRWKTNKRPGRQGCTTRGIQANRERATKIRVKYDLLCIIDIHSVENTIHRQRDCFFFSLFLSLKDECGNIFFCRQMIYVIVCVICAEKIKTFRVWREMEKIKNKKLYRRFLTPSLSYTLTHSWAFR